MSTYALLQVVQPIVYGLLAGLTVVIWLRNRDRPSAWLATTFSLLAAVLLVAQIVPDRPTGTDLLLQRVLVVGLIVFPYLLYRFSASMLLTSALTEVVAAGLTVATIGVALPISDYPAPGEPRTGLMSALLVLLLVQWSFLLGSVAVRFWQAGLGQPLVARARMRTLSAGAVVLAVALLVAGTARPTEDPGGRQIATQLLSILSAPLFFLGFAPPTAVRQLWRRPEEAHLDEVELALLADVTEHEAASLLVPAVSRLIGGGAMLVLDDGKTVVSEGLDAETRSELLEHAGEEVHADPDLITVPMRTGTLVIKGTSCTPFFGREEIALARRLAARTDLALDRARGLALLRQQATLLDLAADAIFVRTFDGVIRYWNQGAVRLYGWKVEEAVGQNSHHLLRPDLASDLDEVNAQVLERGSWEGQLGHTKRDGTAVVVSSRWTLREQPEPLVLEINTDITNRVREEELRERFIANAAHELRTPLTTLVGFAQVLGLPTRTEEQAMVAQDAISRSAQRLRLLVDNLLDLTRLQSDEAGQVREDVDAGELLRSAVDAVVVPGERSVTVDAPEGLRLRTVPELVERVLVNLLTNAARYGGPTIAVSARRSIDGITMTVTDDGPGVEPDVRDRLFDPFARGSSSHAVGGSGLGLAIVRSAVEQLGGKIRYEDAEPRGARFVVELPASPPS